MNSERLRKQGLSALLMSAIFVASVLLAACGSDNPTATATAAPRATTAPQEEQPTQVPAWQIEMERVTAAAKREELSVGLGGGASRSLRPWYERFGDKYGIKVVVSGGSGSETSTRLLAERDAGKYTLDLLQVGAGSASRSILPNNVLDPFEPQILLPEITDLSAWFQGKHWYGDPESKYIFLMSGNHDDPGISVNTNLFNPDEITSYADLLAPKYHGKVVAGDLGTGSSGTINFLYSNPKIGPEWLRELILNTNLQVTGDADIAVNWLVEGKVGIALFLGNRSSTIEELQERGAPVHEIHRSMAEGAVVDSGGSSDSLMLINRAPNANAAKLFINWALSKEGAMAYQEISMNDHFRIDIPKDVVPERDQRKTGFEYIFPSTDPLYVANIDTSVAFAEGLVRQRRTGR